MKYKLTDWPMRQFSTPEMFNGYCELMKDQLSQILQEPDKKSIHFLMQFARTYHSEKKLPVAVSGMILN